MSVKMNKSQLVRFVTLCGWFSIINFDRLKINNRRIKRYLNIVNIYNKLSKEIRKDIAKRTEYAMLYGWKGDRI